MEPGNDRKCDRAGDCDSKDQVSQDQVSHTGSLHVSAGRNSPGKRANNKSSLTSFEMQSLKDLPQDAKDSSSYLSKKDNLNIAKNQFTMTSRHSNSFDECVEIQEYFQEEEIGEDNLNKGVYSDDGNGNGRCSSSSQELLHGLKILNELLSDANKNLNWPFINPVDSTQDGCQDYYERIESPMWLLKMKEKFSRKEYTDITEFVSDMRLMIDNCILFNGSDHSISKKAKKLEMVLNQKVTLLSRDTRDKINEAVPPRNSLVATDTLEQMEPKALKRGKDSRRRMRELQKHRMLERRLMQDHFVNTLQAWDESLFDEVTRPQMKAMWELPQLGLFLFLCSRPLNISITQYELERCFVLSRQSSAMQRLMSSIFSSANQRSKLHLGNLMTSKAWEEKMKDNISSWYKSLVDSNYNIVRVSEKLAIDEKFFKIMGCNNPLATKSFHDLTYYQKVWIVKSVCDYLLNNQKSLLDAIEKQDMLDLRPRELGSDGAGNAYFYFSQFCGDDIRIYRQSPLPAVEIGPLEFTYEECCSTKKRTKKQSKRRPKKVVILESSEDHQTPRARDSRLRQNPRQLKNYQVDRSISSGSTSESDSEDEMECHDNSSQEKSSCTDVVMNETSVHVADKEPIINGMKSKKSKASAVDKAKVVKAERTEDAGGEWAFASGNIPRRSERKIIEESIKNAEPKTETKTGEVESPEKLGKKRASRNDWRSLAPFLPERNLRSRNKNASESARVEETSVKAQKKSKDAKIKSEKKDTRVEPENEEEPVRSENNTSCAPSEMASLDSSEMTEVKNEYTSDNEDDVDSSLDAAKHAVEPHETMDETFEETMDTNEEECHIDFEPTLLGPNLDEFELVAESIQDIRNLIKKIEDKGENEVDLNVSSQSKSGKKNPEKVLLGNLENLLKDLEPHEVKLAQALKKARMQLRKEEETYKEAPDILEEEEDDHVEATAATDASNPPGEPPEEEDADSQDQSAAESSNPSEVVPEVKKKNIFENDIDMALLLTEGRVLRKRNVVQPVQSPSPALVRSKRLLNRPSRYKYDDYLTDDSVMASACNDEDARKNPEESSVPSTPGSGSSVATADSQSRRAGESSALISSNVVGHQVASTEILPSTLPCASTVADSPVNLTKQNVVRSAGTKSSTVLPLGRSIQSNPAFGSANLVVRNMLERFPPSGSFLPLKVATMPPITQAGRLTSPYNQELSKMFPSSAQSPIALAHVNNSVQVNYNTTKIVGQQSGLSILNLPSNSMSPGLILLPKNFSLNQPGVIPQPFVSPVPIGNLSMATAANKSIRISPMTSNVVLNVQNLLPMSNSISNVGNHILRAHSPGAVVVRPTVPLNLASMSLPPRFVIPLKSQIPGNLSTSNCVPPGQFLPRVGGLMPVLGGGGSLPAAPGVQANVGQLPLQVGQLSCENGQSILLIANSMTQTPCKSLQKSIVPAKVSPAVDSSSPIKNRHQANDSGAAVVKTSEAMVQQVVFNNLTGTDVVHRLMSPGLIQVSAALANPSSTVRFPASSSSSMGVALPNKNLINLPLLLNKDALKILSQAQKPLQLNQVTSQGK